MGGGIKLTKNETNITWVSMLFSKLSAASLSSQDKPRLVRRELGSRGGVYSQKCRTEGPVCVWACVSAGVGSGGADQVL